MAGRLAITVLVFIGILFAAAIDHVGRFLIYPGPLYMLPLIFAAWFLTRSAAIVAAIIATGAWAFISLEAGSPYSEPYVWTFNVLLQGGLFLLVTLLISYFRRSVEKERELRVVDPDTGLASRRAFFERAGSVLAMCHRDSQPATLAYIELSNLGKLRRKNAETVVHDMADILTDTLRTSDVIARLDRGSFVVLLPETDEKAGRAALEKLQNAIKQTEREHDEHIEANISAVTSLAAPSDLNGMFNAASRLMRRVKAGRSGHLLVEDMHPQPA